MNNPDNSLDAALLAEAGSAEVVVFRSSLSDTRLVTDWLARHQVFFRQVEFPMASAAERERFHRLQTLTGWRMLPQIFIHGRFVGGISEFFAHAWVREHGRGDGQGDD